MATQRLRPGTWFLSNSGGNQKYQVDYESFEIVASGTARFDVRKMAIYDDTTITAFRQPPEPLTLVSNVGSEGVETVRKAPFLKIKR